MYFKYLKIKEFKIRKIFKYKSIKILVFIILSNYNSIRNTVIFLSFAFKHGYIFLAYRVLLRNINLELLHNVILLILYIKR